MQLTVDAHRKLHGKLSAVVKGPARCYKKVYHEFSFVLWRTRWPSTLYLCVWVCLCVTKESTPVLQNCTYIHASLELNAWITAARSVVGRSRLVFAWLLFFFWCVHNLAKISVQKIYIYIWQDVGESILPDCGPSVSLVCLPCCFRCERLIVLCLLLVHRMCRFDDAVIWGLQ